MERERRCCAFGREMVVMMVRLVMTVTSMIMVRLVMRVTFVVVVRLGMRETFVMTVTFMVTA